MLYLSQAWRQQSRLCHLLRALWKVLGSLGHYVLGGTLKKLTPPGGVVLHLRLMIVCCVIINCDMSPLKPGNKNPKVCMGLASKEKKKEKDWLRVKISPVVKQPHATPVCFPVPMLIFFPM